MAQLGNCIPCLRLSNLEDTMAPFRRPDDGARYAKGLRKAGPPE